MKASLDSIAIPYRNKTRLYLKSWNLLDLLAHTLNPCTQEEETSLVYIASSKPARAAVSGTKQIGGVDNWIFLILFIIIIFNFETGWPGIYYVIQAGEMRGQLPQILFLPSLWVLGAELILSDLSAWAFPHWAISLTPLDTLLQKVFTSLLTDWSCVFVHMGTQVCTHHMP